MASRFTQGISLVEVLVGVSILSVALVFIGSTIGLFVLARATTLERTATLYLAEEGIEIMRAIRDESWPTIETLTLDTPYGFSLSTSTIALDTAPELVDGTYRRTVTLRSVYRNGGDDIVASTTPGASIDPEVREAVVTVGSGAGTTTLAVIITNLFVQ